jgi:WD40 repeat protein
MSYEGHQGAITDLVVLNSKHLASGSRDKTIKVWEILTGWCIFTLKGHSRSITSLVHLKEENKLVSGSLDESIRVWSLENKACMMTIENGCKVKKIISLGYFKPNQTI